MKIVWQIEDADIAHIKNFYEKHKSNEFVLKRIARNIEKKLPPFSENEFWKAMICCLLTTQQKSGPNSAVSKFHNFQPFQLPYEICRVKENLKQFVETTLANFGGLRRSKRIAEEVEYNFHWLEQEGWPLVRKMAETLMTSPNQTNERKYSEIMMEHLKGFGPKQSRNLLQTLGLTKFEIPIDSRITKWLSAFGFPIKLTATALGDSNYYNFVLEGFQKVCEACGIIPCLMDAAIFSSTDEVAKDKMA